jgi:hypothetical protein
MGSGNNGDLHHLSCVCPAYSITYGIRSERQLMEQLNYNLLYRWFVGLVTIVRAPEWCL